MEEDEPGLEQVEELAAREEEQADEQSGRSSTRAKQPPHAADEDAGDDEEEAAADAGDDDGGGGGCAGGVRRCLLSCASVCVCVCAGCMDGVMVWRTLIYLLTSRLIARRVWQCLMLNGGIFLMSVLLAEFVLRPLLRWMLHVELPTSPPLLSPLLPPADVLLLYLYYALWVYPMYCLAFVLSAVWYQDIADAALAARTASQPSPHQGAAASHSSSSSSSPSSSPPAPPAAATLRRSLRLMAEELYRLLLVSLFLVQLSAFALVPYAGRVLGFVHLCWLHSLYSFEYKWSGQGWRLEVRLHYFERRWAYFLGFGAPAAALTAFTPRLIGAAIFAATFPLLIILAVTARPLPAAASPASDERRLRGEWWSAHRWARPTSRLPIFFLAHSANLAILTRIRRWQITATQQQQRQQRSHLLHSTSSARIDPVPRVHEQRPSIAVERDARIYKA